MEQVITEAELEAYSEYLYEEEKSSATIKKYLCDLRKLMEYAKGQEITKKLMIAYKEYLYGEKQYKTSSINSFLVAANRFFEYKGWYGLKVKNYRIQKEAFIPEERDLTEAEYRKLVKTAKKLGNIRMSLLIQTICSTGIRVSELEAVTVAAVKKGTAVLYNKGKERKILIPQKLQMKLLCYIARHQLEEGPVFQTSGGKPLDRSYIWRNMKALCEEADVEKGKVFPHNLRHLFAKSFYEMHKDIAKLADMLGHGSIETTRIYIKTSSAEHRKQLESMGLLTGL